MSKLEMQLCDQNTLFACFEGLQKNESKHQFCYWFMLKVACETILDTEKQQEDKEIFAREVLTAFLEEHKGK